MPTRKSSKSRNDAALGATVRNRFPSSMAIRMTTFSQKKDQLLKGKGQRPTSTHLAHLTGMKDVILVFL
jgi:hypothetical protein